MVNQTSRPLLFHLLGRMVGHVIKRPILAFLLAEPDQTLACLSFGGEEAV
jgi:hypothetical protein